MKGIVAEESISYGIVEPNMNIGGPQQMQTMNSHYQKVHKLQNIPNDPLYCSEGYKKQGVSWIKKQINILTSKQFCEAHVSNISKMKVKREVQVPYTLLLKLTIKGTDNFYAFAPHHCFHFFYKILWAKLSSMNILIDKQEQFINSCDGFLVKKSQFLGNWEPRYVIITQKDGLMSHKSKQEAPSLTIDQTEQLWTRFEIIEGKKYLVFKLWYGIIKQQFGVPLQRAIKWSKAFFSLISRNT